MLLESLLALVEKLRGRIEMHGSSLRQSEALTRYALIDPLLRELGWDTEDPDMVMPEFSVDIYGGGRARPDYALIHAGKQMIVVEAKKLGGNFQEGVSQGVTASVNAGIRYFVATDGNRWEIYETHKPVQLDQKRIASFDLMSGVPSEVCLNALALWRHNVASGSISPAQAPITGGVSEATANVDQSAEPASVAEPASTTPAPSGEWRPLSESVGIDKTLKLQGIMFPDGSSVTTSNWNELTVEVVRWLNDNNRLPTPPFRIQTQEAKTRYVVAEQAIRPSGEHHDGMTEVADGVWVISNLHHDTAAGNARFAIERVGVDPAEFQVRY